MAAGHSSRPSGAGRRKPGPQGDSPFPKPMCFSRNAVGLFRERLAVLRATVYTTSAALRAQAADADTDAATVLQRVVGDGLDREIELIDSLLGRG